MRSKTFIRNIVLHVLLLSMLPAIAAEESATDLRGLRTWTSKKGDTLEATYEKVIYRTVILRKKDGTTVKISRTSLCDEDQAIIKKLSESAISKSLSSQKKESLPQAPVEIHELFGKKLRTSRNKPVSVDTLNDKVIGVYFSAHWCPPCRKFTPELVKFYDKLKADGKPFEIVFVSSDNSKDAMYNYMKEMGMKWLALPYGDNHKEFIEEKIKKSRGIPHLVILNSKGEIINGNAYSDVMRGPDSFGEWEKKN